MRGLIRTAVATGVLGLAAISAIARWPIAETRDLPSPVGDTYRGAYLARSAGCVACHTDTAGGGAALAGGKALVTPFGTFVPPNITPDPVHGIGGMTFAEFAAALRQGVRPDGEAYYPAFPYEFYADFSDQDIADLWAAIRTVPAVAEPAASNDVKFPFNMRWGLKLWRAAYMKPSEIAPVLGKSDAWIRGQELVDGAAHCAACHTGRNLFGGLKDSEALAGSDSLPDGETAPSIRA
ncbi:MAG: cytochrome c, partial [Rhizobiaceae bacterium]|nr:cytochrome c [Rhizobiaceae bacterium]